MKHCWFLLAFLCWSGILFAQQEGNTWYFGYHAGVSFTGGTATALTNGALNQYEGVATISDRSGNLLFYTEGMNVWAANHALMPNGTGLSGTQSTTQTVIAPSAQADSLFYIFYANALGNNSTIWYSMVDLRLNNGLGDVTLKNVVLDSGYTEKMCVVKHANGVDSWLVIHKHNSQEFYSYLINCNGLQPNPVVSSIGSMHNSVGGYLKPCRDGSKLALCLPNQALVEVLRFNPQTGEISNPITLAGILDPYGIEFSPDGRLLYVTTDNLFSEILQFDLLAGSTVGIMASRYQVAVNNFGSYTALQMGPDGKMYAGKSLGGYLATISQPNIAGINCNFTDTGLYLQGKMCFHGLPNTYEAYPHPWLDSLDFRLSASQICLGDTLVLDDQSSFVPDMAKYLISRQGLGVVDSVLGSNGSIVIQQPGVYVISYLARRSCLSDSVQKVVVVRPQPTANLGADTVLCGASSMSLTAAGTNGATWWNGSTAQSVQVSNSGTYWVTITDGLCVGVDSINVDFRAVPVFGADTLLHGCEGNPLTIGANTSGAGHWAWNTGDTTCTLEVINSGTYSLVRTLDDCQFERTIRVDFQAAPSPHLPPVHYLCDGAGLELSTQVKCDYLQWSTGETGNSITVSQAGQYSVKAFVNGCVGESSTEVRILALPTVELPKAIHGCEGEALRLNPVLGPAVETVLWSDGSMDASTSVIEPGIYSVQVSNGCGVAEASVVVEMSAKPELDLGSDRSLCREKEILLSAPRGDYTYSWSDGSAGPQLRISKPGTYSLTLQNACGIASDVVVVSGLEQPTTQIPNVFTPNGDGINDLFLTGVTEQGYSLSVMDRWGKTVFSSQNHSDGWDGRLNDGSQAPEGAYYYAVSYRSCEGASSEETGSVTLMR